MKTERRNITQPDDWWAASLPSAIRKKLAARPAVGAPFKKKRSL